MAERTAVTAIVLAGGRSSRFGGPKLAAELGGATILEHAVRAVAEVAGEVLVAGAPAGPGRPAAGPAPAASAGPARRAERAQPAQPAAAPRSIEGAGVRTVLDEAPFAGPLAALEGALRSVGTELALAVGGDMPGLVPAVLDVMLRRLADDPAIDAVVLHDALRRQVLPVALRVEPARAAAAEALRSGDRSLVRFLDRLRCAELPAREWGALDPDARTLLDVDVPGDLDRIRGT